MANYLYISNQVFQASEHVQAGYEFGASLAHVPEASTWLSVRPVEPGFIFFFPASTRGRTYCQYKTDLGQRMPWAPKAEIL